MDQRKDITKCAEKRTAEIQFFKGENSRLTLKASKKQKSKEHGFPQIRQAVTNKFAIKPVPYASS